MIDSNYYEYLSHVCKALGLQTPIEARKVWFNPPYTTVEFADGTKVTSKATDVEFNKYSGFMACVMKKIYGSTSKCLRMLSDCEHLAEVTSPSYRRKRRNSLLKLAERIRQDDEKRRKEALIQSKMEELQATKEAERRLKKEEENQ